MRTKKKRGGKDILNLCQEVISSLAAFDSSLLKSDEVLDVAQLHKYKIKIVARLCSSEVSACAFCKKDCGWVYVWNNITYVTECGDVISACGHKRRMRILQRYIDAKKLTPGHFPRLPYNGSPQVMYYHKNNASLAMGEDLQYYCANTNIMDVVLTQCDMRELNAMCMAPPAPFPEWTRVDELDGVELGLSHDQIVECVKRYISSNIAKNNMPAKSMNDLLAELAEYSTNGSEGDVL